MSHLLTSISNILDIFYKYCGQDEEYDTMSQSELKEFLENELQCILKNPSDPDIVDEFMLNIDEDNNRRVDFTEFLLLIFKLTMAFNKTFKKTYYEGQNHCDKETEKEEEEEENNWESESEEEHEETRKQPSKGTQKVRYRQSKVRKEVDESLLCSEKLYRTSNLNNSRKSDEAEYASSSCKWRGRRQNSRTSPSRLYGGEEYKADSENINACSGIRYKYKKRQNDGLKKKGNEYVRKNHSVTFEEESEKWFKSESSEEDSSTSDSGTESCTEYGSGQKSGQRKQKSTSGQKINSKRYRRESGNQEGMENTVQDQDSHRRPRDMELLLVTGPAAVEDKIKVPNYPPALVNMTQAPDLALDPAQDQV
ncbi:filaggrin-2-like [Antechinus flavipes]|uniref:filaggrin-2-like n=1 Tax=Antechinus flavipes TaxID=38775 RepID=UPI0022368DBF|nr:filaggrin-2-like [Antechinus flavipes]